MIGAPAAQSHHRRHVRKIPESGSIKSRTRSTARYSGTVCPLRERVIEILDKESIIARSKASSGSLMEEHRAGANEGQEKPGIPSPLAGWDVPLDAGPAPDHGKRFAAAGERPKAQELATAHEKLAAAIQKRLDE
jgi:hypothetical protein